MKKSIDQLLSASVSLRGVSVGRVGFLNRLFMFGTVGLTELAIFSKQLSLMVRSGITILESLQIAEESTSGKLKSVIKNISESVAAGQSLTDSMMRYPRVFSKLFVGAVYAGEQSGTLDVNLEGVAVELEKEVELNAKIRGALIYPLVIVAAALVFGFLISFILLPRLTGLFKGLNIELPLTTRIVIWFSEIIQAYGTYILIGTGILIIAAAWLWRQPFIKPYTHWFFLRLPVARRMVRAANLARLARSLGTLIKSGISIDEALGIAQYTVGNHYYQKSLGEILLHVREGTKLADNLAQYQWIYPRLFVRMVKVGEESGRLEETLFYLANFYDVEIDTSTKSLSAAIEPLLLLFVGLFVGFLAFSIITPIFEFTGGVGR